ncbi:hypothetical protein AMJ40_04650 [candidate division TA06 bacterium DG_26]|uniref:Secretion system C-terminal sorting domain-containing protein n=1 Tax=candidate division TA06 bacterium DG_26 TaxID=1703771 RepID=A0A0S7WHZ0_UNCT6|nr:MAG: hypothetical protein AMJ40_04650 [candidate division TA06 bacterium DG_26]
MNAKLLLAFVATVCLAATGFAFTDNVWVIGEDGGTGDLVTAEVWLEYEGAGTLADSMSAFDVILTWDASVCTLETITIGPDFFNVGGTGLNWNYLPFLIDNQGTAAPLGVAKCDAYAYTLGPPIGAPFMVRGTHLAATLDFRLVGSPGSCTNIDTLLQAFTPPVYTGLVDKAGIVTYLPAYTGDDICVLRQLTFDFDPALCGEEVEEGAALAVTVTVTDNGGQPIDSIWLVDGDPGDDYFVYNSGTDNGVYYWDNPTPAGPYTVTFCAITEDQFEYCFECEFDVITPAAFELEFKKVVAWPGQQHVIIPVWLTARAEVGGWDVLVDFDPTAVQVVDVIYKNFVVDHAIDCFGVHHYDVPSLFNNGYYPEYFNYQIGVAGHPNWVQVTGIMDMEWPQPHTPPVTGDQLPLFALVVDVNPLWNGQEAYFCFRFRGCGDNILSDPTGYVIYGPKDADRPAWLNYCPYIPTYAIIDLYDCNDGCAGLGIMSVTVADLNCNDMACDVGDAIVFVNYLMHGGSALCQGECASMPNCAELQAKASDINGDGYYWTIADLVGLLNCINDNGGKAAPPSGETVELTLAGSAVELNSAVDVGAAYFVMKYEGEITEPTANVDMDLAWNVEDGVLKVLVYSMEANAIEAGTHTLFTVPGAKNLTVEKVEAADAGGAQLGVRISVAPTSFVLHQNRPNPVRTTTDIAYALPTDSKVTLKVYDAAGMLVETLVNEWQARGFHTATWDAENVASGVYFYKLEAGEYSAARKLIRMR